MTKRDEQRLYNRISKSILNLLPKFPFGNNENLRTQVLGKVVPILEKRKLLGKIYDYQVNCGMDGFQTEELILHLYFQEVKESQFKYVQFNYTPLIKIAKPKEQITEINGEE